MKKHLIFALLAVSTVTAATGDVLVTRRIHVDSFYNEGVQRPERTDTVDLWIAPGRAVCLAGPVKIIIDADRDILILANDSAKTYAQATLSRPVMESMTPDDREAMPSHDATAAVRGTGETRVVLGRTCQGYAIDLRANLDHKAKAWVSADVPVELAAYKTLMRKLYAFLGRYDAASVDALLGFPGYVLSQENVADLKGETLRVSRDVTAMSRKTPPEGLFAVPEGYTKKP
ncbi:MAG TPA: DUF4412 domain-containing protein, partial [Acidobacteriota bacterium]|nr:DUF4412 domain-containing protein [Acidobacteriota bacterium]